MSYDDLVREQRIRPHNLSEQRLRASLTELLALADRELIDSRVEAVTVDGRYEHAYASARAMAEAVMTAEGFRPSGGPGQHQVLFDLLRLVPTAQWQGEAHFFDSCRQRRHLVAYRRSGVITETELGDLVEEADRFGGAVRKWLTEHHPAVAPQEPT